MIQLRRGNFASFMDTRINTSIYKEIPSWDELKWQKDSYDKYNSSFNPNSDQALYGSVKWKYGPVDDWIQTSPAVSDEFVHFAADTGKLYTLNVADGSLEWTYEIPSDGGDGNILSSPAIDDTKIYVGSNNNNVYALNGAGYPEWIFETDWDVRSSPTVVDGTVYVGSDDHNVYAIDADDGTVKWAFETDDYVHSSPTVSNDTVYVGTRGGNLYALDAHDGTEEWRVQHRDSVGTPSYMDGTLYYGVDDELFDWEEGNNFFAVNADDGSEEWSFRSVGRFPPRVAVAYDTVYTGGLAGEFYALNAEDGSERWSFSTDADGYGHPIVADGIVYTTTEEDTLYALYADGWKAGSEQWSLSLTDSETDSEPGSNISAISSILGAIADETVYIGASGGYLYAIE